MPLAGFTTDSAPGAVFTPNELREFINGPDNPSDFTPAMAETIIGNLRDSEDLSATSITGVCPREHYFRKTTDYTLRLESQFYSMRGTQFHAMLEAMPIAPGTEAIREQRFGKRIVVDGEVTLLPAKMDEVILDWLNGKALIRDYKTTKAVPKYGTPYYGARMQVGIYRWVLSNVDGPPLYLPDGIEYWQEGAADLWEPWPGGVIDAEYGEVVYVDAERAKRIQMGPDPKIYKARVPDPVEISSWLKDRIRVFRGEPGLTFVQATDKEGGWDFAWKCQDYCPVRSACQQHMLENEAPFDPHVAIKRLERMNYTVTQGVTF